jgi:hypothetical protein
MALYTTYSSDWLQDSQSIKVVLMVVTIQAYSGSWAPTTLYISNAAYITDDGVTVFNPIIKGDVSFSESISANGGISVTYGDVSLANHNGEYDDYLDNTKYIWTNGSIKMYYGDPTWTCTSLADITGSKFLKIFDGTIGDIDSRSLTSLNIKVRDKLQRLNSPLTTYKLGTYGYWAGGQLNIDAIRPVILGEVFNIEPLLIDPSSLQYLFNHDYYVEQANGSVKSEAIIEVRDSGVPIYNSTVLTGATINLTNSKLIINKPPAGTITVSVQGIKDSYNFDTGVLVQDTYSNNIASLIAIIVTKFGKDTTRFTAADLDLVNLKDFSSACPQVIGAAVLDRENVLKVCQDMVSSVGAQLFVNRNGLLRILRYGVGYNTGRVITSITESDIIYNSMSVSNRLPIVASIKLGYCKNWAIQPGLLTDIPQAHKDSFATEWLTVTSTNATVATNYKLDTDPVQKDTMLLTTADATAEANRLLTLYSTQKTVYKFTGGPNLLQLILGQDVTVIHSRFNLYNAGAGVVGQVVSLSPNWTKSSIDVEVLI